MAETAGAGQAAIGGQQLLPLIDHLARVGRRATDSFTSGCLRPRHMIALKLLGERGPMTQHAVSVALSLDPSNVVGLLNELEERGLITRRRDPADRRRHIVELSAAPSGEVTLSCDQLGLVEDGLFKTLTGDERATLYSLLSRAVEALAPVDEPSGCVTPGPAGCLAPPDDAPSALPAGGELTWSGRGATRPGRVHRAHVGGRRGTGLEGDSGRPVRQGCRLPDRPGHARRPCRADPPSPRPASRGGP